MTIRVTESRAIQRVLTFKFDENSYSFLSLERAIHDKNAASGIIRSVSTSEGYIYVYIEAYEDVVE